MTSKRLTYIACSLLATVLILSSCSPKKNTATSRFWQSFTSKYNIYYNGSEAFKEGEKAKVSGHKDNYTEMLPVFLVGVEASRTTGKANYETAITKCQKAISLHSIKRRPVVNANKRKSPKMKAYLQRKEYNPFLKNAWLMMGEAQFEKGDFLEAAATFSYITRLYAAEPAVASAARQWLARCYTQVKWYYDAEDALKRMRRDSTDKKTLREANATQADLLLKQERFEEAIPYLEKAAHTAKGNYRKARLYFLLGQVNAHLSHNDAAYKALRKCIRKSPPFELSFNAQMLQTEVLAGQRGMGKKMIGKLRRMARSDNNKQYLDQVYYAIGNIYMAQNDTTNALQAYETGRAKSTRNGIEKGVLLLRLAEIYWEQRRFDNAQKCYTEAIGLIDKTRPDYEEITRRSKILDKLVPYTSSIFLQDSLQALARMSEAERNAAIDRVIEALKKKEAEERKARSDSAAQARSDEYNQEGTTNNSSANKNTPTNSAQTQGNKNWYFYNPVVVAQGKQYFIRRWGKRKKTDNWRRSNLTVLKMDEEEGFDYAADDSIQAAAHDAANNTDIPQSEDNDTLKADPHTREYYLQQIPFSEEAKAASDAIIMDALYNAGLIEKDELEDFPLAANTLERLVDNYPSFEQLADAYYQLFLLYSRWGQKEKATQARLYMAKNFPDNEMTKTINDPNFEYKARYGKEIEDSLYTATYQAYRERNMEAVERNYETSTTEYPNGINRPKFMFVHALSRMNKASTADLSKELRELVEKYPESDVSSLASMIVKGLEEGRTIGTGTFDIGSLWDRRTATTDDEAQLATQAQQFDSERNAPFLFVMAYPTDSIQTNQLLYEMAHFNFTTFVVRGFDMNVVNDNGLSQFRISGFNSYDEAHAYAQRVFKSAELNKFLKKSRILIVSKHNLDLIGTFFSINDYQTFFDKTFAPINIPNNLPVDTPPIEQHYEDEYTPEQLENINNNDTNNNGEDEGEWY